MLTLGGLCPLQSQFEPVESEPIEIEPIEIEPVEIEPVEIEPVEIEPVEIEPVEIEPVESEPIEIVPVESEPIEIVPVEIEPVEIEPIEIEPVEIEPVEIEPVEIEPVEIEPVEIEPVEIEPVEPEHVEIELDIFLSAGQLDSVETDISISQVDTQMDTLLFGQSESVRENGTDIYSGQLDSENIESDVSLNDQLDIFPIHHSNCVISETEIQTYDQSENDEFGTEMTPSESDSFEIETDINTDDVRKSDNFCPAEMKDRKFDEITMDNINEIIGVFNHMSYEKKNVFDNSSDSEIESNNEVKKQNSNIAKQYPKLHSYENSMKDKDVNDDVTGIYQKFKIFELEKKIQDEPEIFIRCRVHIEDTENMYAVPLDQPATYTKIVLNSRKKCGQAFDLDEVVVEILHKSDTEPVGQVIGILKHIIHPKNGLFVCQVEDRNSGRMVPLNKGVPKIQNYIWKQAKATSGFFVMVYKYRTKSICNKVIWKQNEEINCFNSSSKLFIVRFLKWEYKFPFPLGIVVSVIDPGDTLERARKIIDIEHHIHKCVKKAQKEATNISKTCSLSQVDEREDCRKKLVFTVDSENSTELDDAFSFEVLPDDKFEIGIHISDVSYFVKKDSHIDAEARKRLASFYPTAGKPIRMLPENISCFSLLKDNERLTISVFIIVNSRCEMVEPMKIKKSRIKSKHNLSYKDVESILTDQLVPSNHKLQFAIYNLTKIAWKWRKSRLGVDALLLDVPSLRARIMVEEFMITANRFVAEELYKNYPDSTILKSQLPPDQHELDIWKKRFMSKARNTVFLSKPFLPEGEICRCLGSCTCIPLSSEFYQDEQRMDIKKLVWNDIRIAGKNRVIDSLQSLIISPNHHPQLSVAAYFYHQLQEKSRYICSGDVRQEEHEHYSMNIQRYTHFTSPMRRYVDLVVHRFVSAMIDKRKPEYSQADISNICDEVMGPAVRGKRFKKATLIAHLSDLLQQKPIVIHPVVLDIKDSSLKLICHDIRSLSRVNLEIKTSFLKLEVEPIVHTENLSIKLKWSQRIYDHGEVKRILSKTIKEVELRPDRFVWTVLSSVWSKLLIAGKQSKWWQLLKPSKKMDLSYVDDEDISLNFGQVPNEEGLWKN